MARIKHGHAITGRSLSPTYLSWRAMIGRCEDPNNKRYHRYGGRGIVVCSRWRQDFCNFLKDMGEKQAGYTLDRIDNDGNYEPSNCRWATSKEQGRSNYKARPITAFGKTQLLIDWAHETGIKRETIARRLKQGWTVDRALTEAPDPRVWAARKRNS